MRDVQVVPANEASWDELQAVVGTSRDSGAGGRYPLVEIDDGL
jgi:hypothetical protein